MTPEEHVRQIYPSAKAYPCEVGGKYYYEIVVTKDGTKRSRVIFCSKHTVLKEDAWIEAWKQIQHSFLKELHD